MKRAKKASKHAKVQSLKPGTKGLDGKRLPPPEKFRWKKGQSGNPKGRQPKEECLTSLLKSEIEKICPLRDKKTGLPLNKTWKELIVIATMNLAINGHAAALREVWDRCDGKLKHEVGLSTGPITLRVEYGEDVIGDDSNT